MKRKVVIIGAGSVGLHVAVNAELYGIEDRIVGFLDDDPDKAGKEYYGNQVIGNLNWMADQKNLDVVIGIAFPAVKKSIYSLISNNMDLNFPTLIAKSQVWISEECSVGKGAIIYPGCCINYGSDIGDFVVMNMNCGLGHHASIGRFSSLAPGVHFGGHTTVGEGVDIGIGVSTKQQVTIGDGAVVGGQSMIIRDVPAAAVVMGIPGKEKSERNG